jgi:hypothetical protein
MGKEMTSANMIKVVGLIDIPRGPQLFDFITGVDDD